VRRFLPSLWLLGAAFYAAATLLLDHSLYTDALLAQAAARETVRAKQPLKLATVTTERPAQGPGPAAPLPAPSKPHRDEWVQVAGYTTVVHARPSSISPVVSAYPAGQQLRVIAREGGFARVQDVASGQLGWIEQTSLAPLIRGYREREAAPPEPQVAAAEPSPPREAPAIRPVKLATAPRRPPRRALTMPTPQIAAQQDWEGGIFKKRRDQPQLIATHAHGGDLAALVQRAFSGY
jgi:hypothetical protein